MSASRLNAPSLRTAEGAFARFEQPLAAKVVAVTILALFVLLALSSAVAVPLFEASDEAAHFLYVHALAETGALPIIPSRDDLNAAAAAGDVVSQWSVESHQPPLYYTLAAVLIAATDRSDIASLLRSNDLVFTWGLRAENHNQWLHAPGITPDKTVRAVWIARLFSLALACGTLWCIYRTAHLATGSSAVALASMLTTASIPTFAAISASVNNDNLVTLLSAAAVWWTLRMLRFGLRRYDWAVIALLMSAIALTKFTGLAVGVVVVAGLAFTLRRGTITRVQAVIVVAAIGGALALNAGWWYLRNLELYGDPLALDATAALWGRAFAVERESGGLIAETPRIWQSFWLMIGHLHQPVYGPTWLYLTVFGLMGLAFLGWITHLLSYTRIAEPSDALRALVRDWTSPPVLPVLLLAAVLPMAMLVVGTGSVDISYGRLLFPGLVGMIPLLALGWRGIFGRYAVLLTLPLLAMTALMPYTVIRTAYPRIESVDAVPASAVPLGITVEGGNLTLLGYDPLPRTIARDDAPSLTLYLTGSDARNPALTVAWLSPRGAQNLGQITVYPGMAPTDALVDGVIYRADVPTAPLLSDCAGCDIGTGLLRLELKWQTDGLTTLPTVDATGTARPLLIDAGVHVSTAPLPATVPAPADFGGVVSLDGALLHRTDDTLDVSLVWRIESAPPPDLTATVQIFDADGVFLTNADGEIDGYPARVWIPGSIVYDARTVALPADLPPGQYTVAVGWYTRGDLARLPATADSVRDNLAVIGTFEVRP
ncbi:MAG: glycosyltransferase family 39 protein [Chloroflexi bacterium]|nr:glycosyltransferase family 39 protein [Chloroflexota bacterium]